MGRGTPRLRKTDRVGTPNGRDSRVSMRKSVVNREPSTEGDKGFGTVVESTELVRTLVT